MTTAVSEGYDWAGYDSDNWGEPTDEELAEIEREFDCD